MKKRIEFRWFSIYNFTMSANRIINTGKNALDGGSMNLSIKNRVLKILGQNNLPPGEIILFGSRARGNAHRLSDYDILVIIGQSIEPRKKIDIIEDIRSELADLFISSDIILKSREEVDYYKTKIGSVVREAFKEGVAL
jgi:uncharacterized protein